ncbi:MAG TPA: sugar phosphate nucleotidyltransferase [Ignavibacteriaceae bacterium]|nr:sugar phosphate nucleotidyltransferase [Ignavibacteriaceae bacterium]HQI41336.1 sugar phosphate nucleotidyltransferase [Ignavibacteriaceae bacterium]
MSDGRMVILARGISSRMKKPSTEELNVENKLIKDADEKAKSMIGVGKDYRPFLDYLLFNARESGYYDIVIVIGENDNSIKEYYGPKDFDNDFNGLKISYAVQPIPEGRNKPFGTADALLWGLKSKNNWSGKNFTVCNSDNLYSQKALKLMLNSKYPGAMIDYDREALEFEHSRVERFAITIKNKDGFLVDIIEKPSSEIIENVFKQDGYVGVSMNIFSLDYDLIFPILEKLKPNPERDEKELPDAVKTLANKIPNSVFIYPLSEHVPDLTSKSEILNVKKYLEKYYSDFSF